MRAERGAREPGAEWLACPDCGASCLDRALRTGELLRCRQCGGELRRHRGPHALQTLWALSTAGLVLAVLANVEPILTFDVAGNTQTNRVVTGIFGLVQQGFWPVAALVFFGAIAGPAMHLAACWYVASACCLSAPLPGARTAAKRIEKLAAWNLVPVYAVGVMVAVVKLDLLGTVEWRQGALWILLLAVCSLIAGQFHDRIAVERRLAALPR